MLTKKSNYGLAMSGNAEGQYSILAITIPNSPMIHGKKAFIDRSQKPGIAAYIKAIADS